MEQSNKNNDWKTPSDAQNIQDSVYRTGIAKLINRIHSTSTIYIVAGLCQVALGLLVIVVAILGYITSLWLSTVLTGIASITTMVGFFLVYHTVSKLHDPDLLLRNAMKRVMESKN
ncbi:hypothetical protein [Fodinibius salsisoli]|uniref:Holin-X, holin superfamily III n=1 Tax=Fodinibius salsisoli TaxID=2820877 RepID=A0ABT3PPK3_9BACT|nr:hypothetical protein [Fodinibius salsisoli]MCW9707779.1 hypothetical protein [Fodinibius salsisoli]